MKFDIMKYSRIFFYGGELATEGEVRLIKAIIAQAALDTMSIDRELRKEAIDFFESKGFKYYCQLLEGSYK